MEGSADESVWSQQVGDTQMSTQSLSVHPLMSKFHGSKDDCQEGRAKHLLLGGGEIRP